MFGCPRRLTDKRVLFANPYPDQEFLFLWTMGNRSGHISRRETPTTKGGRPLRSPRPLSVWRRNWIAGPLASRRCYRNLENPTSARCGIPRGHAKGHEHWKSLATKETAFPQQHRIEEKELIKTTGSPSFYPISGIGFPRAEQVLDRLDDLIEMPRRTRMHGPSRAWMPRYREDDDRPHLFATPLLPECIRKPELCAHHYICCRHRQPLDERLSTYTFLQP